MPDKAEEEQFDRLLLGVVVVATTLGGALAFFYLTATALTIDSSALLSTLFFTILIVLAGLFPLPVASWIKASVTTAPLFAVAVLLPSGNAVIAGLVGSMVYQVGLRWRPGGVRIPLYKYPFNAGEVVLSTGAATFLFHALGGNVSEVILPALPAALAMYFVNTSLVTVLASLTSGYPILKLWLEGTRSNGPSEVALYSFGVVGAVSYGYAPVFSVAALSFPVWIIYLAFDRLANANQQLEQALSDLRDLQGRMVSTSKLASVGTMSLDLAHQVRNPLFVIIARLERLQERMDEEHPLRPEVDKALSGAMRIHHLTDNLLAMARNQWLPIDVGELVEDAIGMASADVTRRAPVIRSVPDNLPTVQGNPVLLREALSNLVGNALEASRTDMPVNVRAMASSKGVTIEVSDSGIGISEEHLARLFEPFQTTKVKGLGLGLFSAKHILSMHGGALEIRSQEGEGTSVIMQLPLVPETA